MEYSVADYGTMIADNIRTNAYFDALKQVITSDSVVLDIGTGTGIAALIACRLGARRVFAVDPSPVIDLGRQAARDNGYSDRIEFFEDSSTSIELPERADVVVSDLHGVLPHYTLHLRAIEDARQRHLKPGGVLIPQRETVWFSLAEAPDEVARYLDVWRTHSRGFDLEAARTLVSNQFWKASSSPNDTALSEPLLAAELNYATGDTGDLSAALTFTSLRDGQLNGLYGWFDSVLVDGLGFSNAPGRPASLYGQGFFPIPDEVALVKGEEVNVNLSARFVAGDYLYRWDVAVGRADKPALRFRQSTFAGVPLSTHTLHAAGEAHVPLLSGDGVLARLALELMDGTRTVGEIVELLASRAESRDEALNVVTALSQKYSA